jgi:transcriptional regulator with XRE-family HTH domain
MPRRKKPNVGADMDRWVGIRLRSRRQQLGISAARVAEQLDVQRQSVDKWENGAARMSVGQLHEVSLVLGVHPGWFYEEHPVGNLTDYRPRDIDMVLQIPDAVPLLLDYARLDDTERAGVRVLLNAAGRDRPMTLDGKGKPLVAAPHAPEDEGEDAEGGGNE